MKTNMVNVKNLMHFFIFPIEGIATQPIIAALFLLWQLRPEWNPPLDFAVLREQTQGVWGCPSTNGSHTTSRWNSGPVVLSSTLSFVFTTSISVSNRFQGEKAFGLLREERRLAEINEEFLCDQKYRDEENLPEKHSAFKEKYMAFYLNNEGKIDLIL